jgi:fumarate reductase subunit C
MGAGAAILAGLLDHHVRSNDFFGLNLLWFVVPLLLGHGMVFLGSGYRQAFASFLRNKISWYVIATLIGVVGYNLTATYLALPKTLG